MHVSDRFRFRNILQLASSFAAVALVLASVVVTCSQPAKALPAFAKSMVYVARLAMSRGRC